MTPMLPPPRQFTGLPSGLAKLAFVIAESLQPMAKKMKQRQTAGGQEVALGRLLFGCFET
ncbi:MULTISPECIES: hypothetical protein [Geobacillus]|uniref:Uncharacterized protein n=2 Tax=Geobacillus thermodenitrificans TaxID=33940 RepID=A0ABY9QEN3_GEOTD|nr:MULTISPECIES: hypothetical protein [Geobacillus]MED3716165.1 hypothetical protein [Geobacillus thermodenitrificans]MED3907434.1 hypothetical protein [Geobacillus thermodenitrificans]MED4916466.1 hypothetical protein [Geobacillus thermodenitrificans]WMV76573.1 hypothetical protein HSX42_01740 [Geobacillus thermodenitrificans]